MHQPLCPVRTTNERCIRFAVDDVTPLHVPLERVPRDEAWKRAVGITPVFSVKHQDGGWHRVDAAVVTDMRRVGVLEHPAHEGAGDRR